MKRVLIIKTSSLGDVIHTLPAVSDAFAALPGLRFDWVVEEALAEIPRWHRAVSRVIPVALRRWRRRPWRALASGEWRAFRGALRAEAYDKIIDAQGLLKSAWLAAMARGRRCGLARDSAREGFSALVYHERHSIGRGEHAVRRVRELFARCLGYAAPGGAIDYGIAGFDFPRREKKSDYLVFLHGTTWSSKLWPERYWCELLQRAAADGLRVLLPWGDAEERERARRIAQTSSAAEVLDRMSLAEIAGILRGARGAIAVDTGLGHLAAALDVPCVTLYGSTQPGLTGTLGAGQVHLRARFPCSPCMSRRCRYRAASEVVPACYATLPPTEVWRALAGTPR